MAISIRKTYFLGFIVALFVLVSALLLTGFSIQAKESTDNIRNKYFTSITVEEDETLWSIATEYRTEEYNGIDKYIDEIKSINNLNSDTIKTGDTLIVPYYSDEIK